jgi:hypothetical protein
LSHDKPEKSRNRTPEVEGEFSTGFPEVAKKSLKNVKITTLPETERVFVFGFCSVLFGFFG